ncbi:xanthine dehydrogenase family protein molybdopterin-binding subunit [Marinibactrum halimedae]|uniref:Oxidoreductase subunit beta n=1 Tax=Marinibactrum halimedae TaxID=1444977 RepID=A0AA37T5P4_9GAMM|nr:xanthine dehydrogenase family protein molybdopterin-binding subunit [Marinibactrum halimedae]MCD9458735.1 xanthine dehydrogenase family protein molybdopterin-binding subunit [Marinibactrum halimedae]GLS25292.1 oxidoreductase subunit beta [Marinibactrum halimedae]
MSQLKVSRRGFMGLLGAGSGGLVLSASLSGCASGNNAVQSPSPEALVLNAFLQITPENTVHFYLPREEMGQGSYHGLTTLVAEELDVLPERITVQHAPVNKAFNHPEFGMQGTGGSTSMKVSFYPLRQAGANARAMLVDAAAAELGVSPAQLKTEDGHIITTSGERHPYGRFVQLASTLPTPENVPLKNASDFNLIGKQRPRIDGISKSTGTAQFGIDVDLPNLHKAVIIRSPVYGAKPVKFDATEALKLADVAQVFAIDNGVAIVAKHIWTAKKAAKLVSVEWSNVPLASQSSTHIRDDFASALDTSEGEEHFKSGEGVQALQQAESSENSTVVEAEYWVPFLAHATMEPMNCTIQFNGPRCDIWLGTQMTGAVQSAVAYHGELDKENVFVHTTLLGGSFGRRGNLDYVVEAVEVGQAFSKSHPNTPVQIVWSREDDMRHDYYRPAALARLKASIDDQGQVQTWAATRSGGNMMSYILDEVIDVLAPGFLPNGMVDWLSKRGYGLFENWVVDPSSVEGLHEDYDVPNKEVRHVTVDHGMRLGFLRSVGHSYTGFFKESFMDELAIKANMDPVEMRLNHTQSSPRLNGVIREVAKVAQWGKPQQGRFQGIAAHRSFDSYVAQIAEVSVEGSKITVHKVTCVVDCGRAVNPDMVKAQMEGGIIFGLSAALYGEITFKEGAVEQSNFHDYRLVRLAEAPEVEVHIIDSQEDPTGVGEPGVPPIAPAVANAVFQATGQRLRSLPLKLA